MATRQTYSTSWAERAEKDRRSLAQRAENLTTLAGRLARVLAEHYGVRRVCLFGSLASRTHFHEASDIDLAVEGLPPHRYFEALSELWDLLPAGVELDLVPLEFGSAEVLEVVRTQGVELYALR